MGSPIRPGPSEAVAQLTNGPSAPVLAVRAFPASWVPPHMLPLQVQRESGTAGSRSLAAAIACAAVSAASSRRRRRRRQRANLWRAGPTPPPLKHLLSRGFSRRPRRPRPSRPTTHATQASAVRRTGLGFARRPSRPRRPRRHRRRRTRARHATSPSRPTSSPPGKHAAPLPRLLDRCLMIYQRGNIGATVLF